MSVDELVVLITLLKKWINAPGWNRGGEPWAKLVETCRLAELELYQVAPDMKRRLEAEL